MYNATSGPCLLLVGALLTFAPNLCAQVSAPDSAKFAGGQIPIVVAVASDHGYPDAEAVLLRLPRNTPPYDVILLSEVEGSVQLVANALSLLQTRHMSNGWCVGRREVLRVERSDRVPSYWNSSMGESWIPGLLAKVSNREEDVLPGVGRVRWMRTWIPRSHPATAEEPLDPSNWWTGNCR